MRRRRRLRSRRTTTPRIARTCSTRRTWSSLLDTGAIEHQFLTGVELGRQETDNFRNTGFFGAGPTAPTSVSVPVSNPRTTQLVTAFRQSATDADNSGTAKVAAIYVQDQLELTSRLIATLGLRYDDFKVDFTNRRTGENFDSDDGLLSPRAGLVYKPVEAVSLYASYSKTFQPRAGEQLSSLSLNNQSLDPEEFRNYEVGAKWKCAKRWRSTWLSTSSNERMSRLPIPPTLRRPVRFLIDGQRVTGVELGLTGNVTSAWSVMAAFAYQDGEILSNQTVAVQKGRPSPPCRRPRSRSGIVTTSARCGAWSRRSQSREDVRGDGEPSAAGKQRDARQLHACRYAAVFFRLNEKLRAQANVENLFGEDYFVFANSNTNITPGSPRAVRTSRGVRLDVREASDRGI